MFHVVVRPLAASAAVVVSGLLLKVSTADSVCYAGTRCEAASSMMVAADDVVVAAATVVVVVDADAVDSVRALAVTAAQWLSLSAAVAMRSRRAW